MLRTFRELAVPGDVRWELIVVDNNSSDSTRQVCESLQGTLPIRYLFEPNQGKSRALNRSLTATAAPLLAFTDDDVDVDAHWLAEIVAAARRNPDAGFFHGRIFARWECPPPAWLAEHATTSLSPVAVHFDRGDRERVLTEKDKPFFGANLTFRRDVFANGLRFREDLGRGNGPVPGEEEDVIEKIMAKGGKGVYVPGALVHHRNPPGRMTESYMRQWCKGAGMKEVRVDNAELRHLWFGAPRWYWKQLVLSAFKCGATRWTRPASVWLPAEMKMAMTWGAIVECRNRTRNERSTR